MLDRDALIEKYRNATSEQQMAEIEDAIWQTVEDKRSKMRRDCISEMLSIPQHSCELRSTLFNSKIFGVDAVLWDRVDNKNMPLFTAVRLLRQAKQISLGSHGQMSVSQALSVVLDDYDNKKSVKSVLESGQVVHRSIPLRRRRSTKETPANSIIRDVQAQQENSAKQEEIKIKSFWQTVKQAFAKEMSDRFNGVDPSVQQKLQQEFEADLNSVLDSFKTRLDHVRRRGLSVSAITLSVETVSRSQVVNACKVLHMDPPSTQGRPVDMSKAKKMKMKLVRLYHPDHHGGKEEYRSAYESVIQAYETLSQYMSHNSNFDTNRN